MENNSALSITVPSAVQRQSVTYYILSLSKVYQIEVHNIERRFSKFEALNLELHSLGYTRLPELPKSFMLIQMQSGIEQRRKDLEIYMRALLQRKDTRHSLPVVKFLELDQFCPELIYQRLELV